MKKLILAIVVLFSLALPLQSEAENAFGIRAGYCTRNSAPVAGLWFKHSFAPHLRLSPNIDYYFRHRHTDALAINCNAEFPFKLCVTGRAAIYPFAGLNYTSWNYHESEVRRDADLADDVTTRLNRFGLNAGIGIEVNVTSTLRLAFEAKTTLIKSYSSGGFTASIGYCF